MKLLLATVTALAVFTADGRNFHHEPGEQTSTGETYLFLNETDTQGGQNLQSEPKILVSAEQYQPLAENKVLENGLYGSETTNEDHQIMESTNLVLGEYQDKNYSNLNYQKTQQERKNNKSSCKAKTICVLLGGFCLTNAKLCDGRLVSQGCKGAKCQCCVPDILVQLEEKLQSFSDNMNNSNAVLESELHFLKVNLNNMSSDIGTELDTLNDNVKNMSQNINSKVGSINSNLKNMSSNLESMKININSIKAIMQSQVTTSPIPPTTAAPSTTPAVTTSPIPPTTAAPSTTPAGCPGNCFYLAASKQCFKMYNETGTTWSAAVSKCQSAGLVLAKPNDPVSLLKYIAKTYGPSSYSWLYAKGDGHQLIWQQDGQKIANTDSLWYPGKPGSRVTTNNCLVLYTGGFTKYPSKPLWPWSSCSSGIPKPLCECKMKGSI